MGDKKPENEITALPFKVKAGAVNLLLHGKSPKYEERFKSWAKNTSGEHLNNLVDAMLSAVAYVIATGNKTDLVDEDNIDKLQGYSQGILLVREVIKLYSSETKEENLSQDEYSSLLEMLG